MVSRQIVSGRNAGASAVKSPVKRAGMAPRPPKPRNDTALRPIAPQEQRQIIAKAAYLRAERRGFVAGGELQDWLEAEAEIDALLKSR